MGTEDGAFPAAQGNNECRGGASGRCYQDEWRQLRAKNDACAPFFAQTGRPNVDSGSVGTSARMLMMSLSKRNYMGTIRVPFVLIKR